MEKDENRKNLIIVIVLSMVLVGVSIFVLVDHFLTKDSIKNEQEEIISNDNDDNSDVNNQEVTSNYKKYNVGDSVTLIDSSSWHVIISSDANDEEITLLKDEATNTYITQNEIDNYLENTYSRLLEDSLSSAKNKIIDIESLNLDDIRNITGDNTLDVNSSINNSYLWLYQNKTLINDVSDNGNLLVINNNGNIIEGTNSDVWPIRPVVTLSKTLIKQ